MGTNSRGMSIQQVSCIRNDYNEESDEWHLQLLQCAGENLLIASEMSEDEASLCVEYVTEDILLTVECIEGDSTGIRLRDCLADVTRY